MPNQVDCELHVTGDHIELKTFFRNNQYIDNDDELLDLSFRSHFPKPEEETDWRNWQINNWGTKWDCVCHKVIHHSIEHIEYWLQTAWTAPIEWLKKLGDF